MSVEEISDLGATPVVEVKNLTVRVRRGSKWVTLLQDLNYRLDTAECLAIVGESGAGKSIGARAALGLLDPRRFKVTGSVRFDGREVLGLSAGRWRRQVAGMAALVFQSPGPSLNPTMSVGQQIVEAMLNGAGRTGEPRFRRDSLAGRAAKNRARERAVELMRDVGIAAPEDRFAAFPHELSGGMKQRIVIAIALACNPRVIFCDEPTSSLDVTTQAAIMDLLDRLRVEKGISTVVITHDLALAASRAGRVLVMYGGQPVEVLPSAGIARSARMPYTRALIRAVPDIVMSGAPPEPIQGLPPDPADPPPGCPFAPRCAFVQNDCRTKRPPMAQLSDGHLASCWHPLEPDRTQPPQTRNDAAATAAELEAPRPAAPDGRPLLQLVDVEQRFRSRGGAMVSALDKVSLTIHQGETFGLVGETGSGKSTLARSVLGTPGPYGGQVLLNGEVMSGANRSGKVQMVFQDPYAALDPRWSVERSVGEPLIGLGLRHGTVRRRRIAEVLHQVGLSVSRFGHRMSTELSGGQAQRVAIARALVARPELLVLDEPVTGLDVSVQAQILALLFKLKSELSLTSLLIAHDLAVVRILADRTGIIYLGRICETGPTEELFEHPAHPYTAALLTAIPPGLSQSDVVERAPLLGEQPSPLNPPSGCRFRTRCVHAQDTCAQVVPELREVAPGHEVACHFPLFGSPGTPGARTAGQEMPSVTKVGEL
jgi:peptide/nickel transport system ATP-binding protein